MIATFKDAKGDSWGISIKTQDIDLIKLNCRDRDDKPVDILAMAETGRLSQLIGNVKLLVDMTFVLCLPQIRERFDPKAYEEEFSHLEDLIPNFRTESWIVKAGRWFGHRIDGNALCEMTEAFREALINFSPSEAGRRALAAILEKEEEILRLTAERAIAYANKSVTMAAEQIDEMLEAMSKPPATELGDKFRNMPE